MSLESELRSALKKGRSHEVHKLTQLLSGRGIGVRNRLFFHLLSRSAREERGGRQWRSGARIPGGYASPRTDGSEYADEGKIDPQKHGNAMAKGSAKMERASRTLPHARLTP